jgi:hypothetical protein
MSKGGRKGGLAFLETKSWAMNNPANGGQNGPGGCQKQSRAGKAKEVLHERELERQKEEIKRQQIESGHIEAGLDRMEWMYERSTWA